MTNRIQDAFDSVKADARLKESTKRFLRGKSQEHIRPRHRRPLKYAASFACAAVFLLIGAVGYSWIRTPVSYVSIDVNPSIELALNRFDRVVSATAYNVESMEILDGLSLRWKKYTDALHAVIECESMRAYLTEKSELVLTVAADEQHKTELETGVQECAGHMQHNCHNVNADVGMVTEAHECGLSLGKYNVYQKLLAYGSTVTVEECRDMSMTELQALLREYEGGGSSPYGGDGKGDLEGGNENATESTDETMSENMNTGNSSSSHHGEHHQHRKRRHGW